MYLTQSELEETFRNMHRILEEFGGFWVTTDNEIVETQKRLITVLAPGRESVKRARKPENAFFDPDRAGAFVQSMGFSLEKVPVSEYLPDTLNTLAGCPEEVHKAARAVFRKMHFWKMRAQAPAKRLTGYDQDFVAEFRWEKGTLDIALRGRLDTMTAPERNVPLQKRNGREKVEPDPDGHEGTGVHLLRGPAGSDDPAERKAEGRGNLPVQAEAGCP